MGKYIHKFDSVSDFNSSYNGDGYEAPWLGYDGSGVSYNNLRHIPMTFHILEGGTVKWSAYQGYPNNTIEYSLNGGQWTSISSGTGAELSVSGGDRISFRGDNDFYATSTTYSSFFAGSTCTFNIYGNFMSMFDPEDFASMTELPDYPTMAGSMATGYGSAIKMFQACKIISARNLLLPSTVARNNCYYAMFNSCQKMVYGPQIFLENITYTGCKYMFQYCTKLKYLKCMATTINEPSIRDWMYRVPEGGTLVKNSSAADSIWTGYLPTGWSIVTE